MKRWRIIALLVIMTSMLSCFDADLIDPDKIDTENIDLKPKMIFPVITADVTMEDVLTGNTGDETEIVSDADGYISLMYTQENIGEFFASEILEFPTSNPPITESIVIPEEVKLLGSMAVPSKGVKLDSIEAIVTIDPGKEDVVFSELSANFDIAIDVSPQPFKYELRMEFENEGIDAQTYTVNRNEELSKVINFSTIKFDTDDAAKRNAIIMKSKVTVLNDGVDVDFGALTNLGLNFTMENFVFNSVKGDFGNMEIDFPADSFDLGVEGADVINGSIKFNNPKLSLILTNNNLGMPFSVDLNLEAKKADKSISIKKGDQPILHANGADAIDEEKVETLSYTRDNSNIVDFLGMFPMDSITYEGKLTLNPKSAVNIETNPNFLTKDATLKVDMKMELPLDFTTTDLKYEEKFEDVDLNIDEETKDKILAAKLKIKAANGWPLGVSIERISFQDEAGVEISSIIGGDIISLDQKLTDEVQPIEMGEDVINSLDKVKNIVLSIVIETPETGAKLNNNDKLSITLAIEASLDLFSSDNN